VTGPVAPPTTPLRASVIVNDRAIDGASLCDALDWSEAPGPGSPDRQTFTRWCAEARDKGIGALRLCGGEPLLRDDVFDLVAEAHNGAFDVELVTSGRLLLYPELRQAVARAGLGALHVPLHGASPTLHDRLVRVPGAWAQVTRALRRLWKEGSSAALHLRVALVRENLEDLQGIPSLAARLGAHQIDLCFATKGPAPRPDEAGAYRRALESFSEAAQARQLPWSLSGLPPCLHHKGGLSWSPGTGGEALDATLAAPTADRSRAPGDEAFRPLESKDRVHGARCLLCAHSDVCVGLPAFMDHAEWRAAAPALPGPLPNSFHLEPITRGRLDPETCPRLAFEALSPTERRLDVDRHLFWLRGEEWQLLEAQTDYFSRANLAETKALGMLYVNLSGVARVDQFQEQLRKLEPSPACSACDKACPGGFAVSDMERLAFADEEASLRAQLGALEGEVLDVGFGPGFYRDVFASLHAEGRIRYHGLDPDPAAVEAARGSGLEGRYHLAVLEDCDQVEDGPVGPFDHVLLLRSWNHLSRLEAAALTLARLLKPGGRLLIVENLRFGYHVPPEVPREEGGRYEHHRNHDLDQAEALLVSLGFETIQREPIVPGSENQWLLELRWPAS
jgi:SAM-dependent methyltransferase